MLHQDLYGIDMRVTAFDAPLTGSGTILFELQGIGSASLDFDAQSLRSGGAGVFLLLESADPEELLGRPKRQLSMFFVLAEDNACMSKLDLHAKAEFSLTMIPRRSQRCEGDICTMASSSSETVVFHGRGCSTMIGFITVTVSVIRIRRSHNNELAQQRALPLPPNTAPPIERRGVGMMAAVEFHASSHLASGRQGERSVPLDGLTSGAMNIIATNKCVSIQAGESTQMGGLLLSTEDCLDEAPRRRTVRPPQVIRSTEIGPIQYYIERDQSTGTERTMQFVPGYSERKSEDRVNTSANAWDVTKGRFSFSLDDCSHHKPAGPTVSIEHIKEKESTKVKHSSFAACKKPNAAKKTVCPTHVPRAQSTFPTKKMKAPSRGGEIAVKSSKSLVSSSISANARGQKNRLAKNRQDGPRVSVATAGLNIEPEEDAADECVYVAPKMSSVVVPKASYEGNGQKPSWWPLKYGNEAKPIQFVS